ncbi:MAG TPA: hypothetical protein VFK04_12850 [Gemmatimonadaceae bacterium]|nr:hypothetical protein [Gemmatimonadaceae bacterium]
MMGVIAVACVPLVFVAWVIASHIRCERRIARLKREQERWEAWNAGWDYRDAQARTTSTAGVGVWLDGETGAVSYNRPKELDDPDRLALIRGERPK